MATVAGIEGGFAHQPMDTGFGTQPAVSVFAGYVNSRTFNARDFAGRCFDNLGLETVRFGPAQVHAQQHLGPVLRLGSTGTRLNIEEGIMCIHFTGEHAAKFQSGDIRFKCIQISHDGIDAIFIVFFSIFCKQNLYS